MSDAEDEVRLFGEFLEKWDRKIQTYVNNYAMDWVVGYSKEDLTSLAYEVLLKCLRRYNPETVKFSTFFYTCLRNRFASAARECGIVWDKWKVRLTNKITGDQTVCTETYYSKSEAESIASGLESSSVRAEAFKEEDKTGRKRIPPHKMESVDALIPVTTGKNSFEEQQKWDDVLKDRGTQKHSWIYIRGIVERNIQNPKDRQRVLILFHNHYHCNGCDEISGKVDSKVRRTVKKLRSQVCAILEDIKESH